MKEPTIQDIARLARVSLGTVSNVLNARPSVKEELVLRVNAAAQKLGYRRNANAASLRSNQTDMIAVAVPNIENAFFSEIVSSIEHLGIAERKGVMFLTTSEDQERAQRQVHSLISRRVDGLIIVPSFDFQPMIPDLETYGVPVVLVDRVEKENPFPSVAVDNFQAGYVGGRHLFDAGHRRVAFFGHGHRFWILNQRRKGFLAAAREAGTAELCPSYEFSLDPEDIRATSLEILARKDRPQAIYAASNIAAKGVIPAIQALGLRVPDDIALLVMDDFEALTLLSPAVSVVAQPSTAIAETGWRMLQALIAGERLRAKHVRLPARLIVRGSTLLKPVAKQVAAR
ncbi:MAG: LacI family transcriptional regulator [Alphaproteobacteria bacterium]|nr:MAG: LacI family transcriptional regulator [Alphaproteobacteria bacterium]